jgi:hypothetical protein
MRIVVDSYPKNVRECLFSKLADNSDYYICTLREYIPEADLEDHGYKPNCICKDVNKCKLLVHESY